MVHVPRIHSALGRFGDRFAQRILTSAELRRYAGARRPADFLAKHFAAKEAFVKALGTGFRLGVSWRDMELRSDRLGRPYLVCDGRVGELLDEFGAGESHLSLCDEADCALAFVTLLKR